MCLLVCVGKNEGKKLVCEQKNELMNTKQKAKEELKWKQKSEYCHISL